MKLLIILILVLISIGCSGVQEVTYESPMLGPTSKLRVVNPDGTAYLATFAEAENCTNRKRIFSKQKGTSEYVAILANEYFAFSLHPAPNWRRTCSFSGIFKPMESAKYDFKVSYTKSHCTLDLVRVEQGKELMVDYKPMQFVTAWTEKGSWCKAPDKPMTNKAKLYNPQI